jgi:hypothetical protein
MGWIGLVGLARFELATVAPQPSAAITSAEIRASTSPLVRRWSVPGERWRRPLNASQLLQSLLHQPLKGGTSKINTT